MRRGLLLAALLASTALAGCNVGGDEKTTPTPTPRVVSRSIGDTPARIELVSFHVSPNETEAGRPVTLTASLRNTGGSRGEAVVAFEIVGGPSENATAAISAGDAREISVSLTPTTGGNLAARVRLGEIERVAALLVRAPRLANLTVEASAVEPCGALRLTMALDNVGDAAARNVHADLDVLDEADALIVSLRPSIGDVPAGQRGEAIVDVPEARTACEGKEPRVFAVRLVVHTDGLPDAQLTGVVTA